ncbi:MAG TPA: hypothetical protein VMU75_16020 [Acidimicrobiales bacterium]|nr:hypothetical protein [Acidimicrobiales bacterium]
MARRRSPSRQVSAASADDRLVRTATWRGLRPHDAIHVRGKPGQQRRWEFLAFVQNTVTGECFIEVVGGKLERNGHYQRNVRMFPPERCSLPPRRSRRVAPDDASVQLSFDGP